MFNKALLYPWHKFLNNDFPLCILFGFFNNNIPFYFANHIRWTIIIKASKRCRKKMEKHKFIKQVGM